MNEWVCKRHVWELHIDKCLEATIMGLYGGMWGVGGGPVVEGGTYGCLEGWRAHVGSRLGGPTTFGVPSSLLRPACIQGHHLLNNPCYTPSFSSHHHEQNFHTDKYIMHDCEVLSLIRS